MGKLQMHVSTVIRPMIRFINNDLSSEPVSEPNRKSKVENNHVCAGQLPQPPASESMRPVVQLFITYSVSSVLAENKKQLHHCTSAIRNRTSMSLDTNSEHLQVGDGRCCRKGSSQAISTLYRLLVLGGVSFLKESSCFRKKSTPSTHDEPLYSCFWCPLSKFRAFVILMRVSPSYLSCQPFLSFSYKVSCEKARDSSHLFPVLLTPIRVTDFFENLGTYYSGLVILLFPVMRMAYGHAGWRWHAILAGGDMGYSMLVWHTTRVHREVHSTGKCTFFKSDKAEKKPKCLLPIKIV